MRKIAFFDTKPYDREAFDRFWAEYCYFFLDGEWFCSDGNGWQPGADWLE